MKFLINEQLGKHRYKTKEGYLVCVDAIIARTGSQRYAKNELFADSEDDDTEIDVDRPYEEVFSPETIASFENKPFVNEHPDENVNVDNFKNYSIGWIRDVHEGTDNGKPVLLANIIVTDPEAIQEIESNEKNQLSCGYDCDILKDEDGKYFQHKIRGNHLALCETGRAGNARIQDSVKDSYIVDTSMTVTTQVYIFNGHNLLIQNRKGHTWTGLAVPGGHVKHDEPTMVSAIREVKEETGLDVKDLVLFGTHQYTCPEDGESIAMLYYTTNFSGELKSSEEGEMSWMNIENVLENPDAAEGFTKLAHKAWTKVKNLVKDSIKDGEQIHVRADDSKIQDNSFKKQSKVQDNSFKRVKDEKFIFTVHYKNGKINQETVNALNYHEALKTILKRKDVDSVEDIKDSVEDSMNLKELEDKLDRLPCIAFCYTQGDKIIIDSSWKSTQRQTEKDRMDLMKWLNDKVGKNNYDLRYEKLQWRDNNSQCSIRFTLTLKNTQDSIDDYKEKVVNGYVIGKTSYGTYSVYNNEGHFEEDKNNFYKTEREAIQRAKSLPKGIAVEPIDDSIKDVNPKEGESKEDFISRFMSETKSEYPDEKQRFAVANSYWERKDSVEDDIPRKKFKYFKIPAGTTINFSNMSRFGQNIPLIEGAKPYTFNRDRIFYKRTDMEKEVKSELDKKYNAHPKSLWEVDEWKDLDKYKIYEDSISDSNLNSYEEEKVEHLVEQYEGIWNHNKSPEQVYKEIERKYGKKIATEVNNELERRYFKDSKVNDARVECLVSNAATSQRICAKYRCQLAMIDYSYKKDAYMVQLSGSRDSILNSLKDLDNSGLLVEYPKGWEYAFDDSIKDSNIKIVPKNEGGEIHYEGYVNGKFICSGDTKSEVEKDIQEYLKGHKYYVYYRSNDLQNNDKVNIVQAIDEEEAIEKTKKQLGRDLVEIQNVVCKDSKLISIIKLVKNIKKGDKK